MTGHGVFAKCMVVSELACNRLETVELGFGVQAEGLAECPVCFRALCQYLRWLSNLCLFRQTTTSK